MTFFLDEMYQAGKIIYYLVTSWLLFLLVMSVKKWRQDRKKT